MYIEQALNDYSQRCCNIIDAKHKFYEPQKKSDTDNKAKSLESVENTFSQHSISEHKDNSKLMNTGSIPKKRSDKEERDSDEEIQDKQVIINNNQNEEKRNKKPRNDKCQKPIVTKENDENLIVMKREDLADILSNLQTIQESQREIKHILKKYH